jgi:hypothetical protein
VSKQWNALLSKTDVIWKNLFSFISSESPDYLVFEALAKYHKSPKIAFGEFHQCIKERILRQVP